MPSWFSFTLVVTFATNFQGLILQSQTSRFDISINNCVIVVATPSYLYDFILIHHFEEECKLVIYMESPHSIEMKATYVFKWIIISTL
mgnify:CR=1 FL=1